MSKGILAGVLCMNFVFANDKVPFWFWLCVWESKVQGGECWWGLCEVSGASRVAVRQRKSSHPRRRGRCWNPWPADTERGRLGGGGVRLRLRLEATRAQIQPRNEEISKVRSRCNLWCLSNTWHGVQNKASPRCRMWGEGDGDAPGGHTLPPMGWEGLAGGVIGGWTCGSGPPSTLSSHPACPRWSPVGSVPFPVNPN